ncbi:hypothetical protein FACS189454_00060 [Planctomycetales bacterium]|nr:hypothetical protein FACS189454_00060 [Planctomycetales bacterium]
MLCSFVASAQDKGGRNLPQTGEKTETKPGKHIALLISVQNYYQKIGLKPLKYCNRDMENLENNLHKFGFTVVRMSNEAKEQYLTVTRANVEEQLKELIQEPLTKNDVLVIAYSGHGIQEGNRRYLCPPDTPGNYHENKSSLIPLFNPGNSGYPGLLDTVEKGFKGQCFVFLDACRTGENKVTEETLYPKSKRIHIMSACEEGKPSYEEPDFGQGRFMYYVNKHLNDAPENVPQTFGQLFEQVKKWMLEDNQERFKNNPQEPMLFLGGETASLVLGTKTPKNRRQTVARHQQYSHVSIPKDAQSKPFLFRGQQPSAEREFEQTVTDIVQVPSLYGEWWFQEMPWYLPVVRSALSEELLRKKDDGKHCGEDILGRDIYAYLNTNTQEAKETLWKYVMSDECQENLRENLGQEIIQLLTSLKEFNNTQDQHIFIGELLTKLEKCFVGEKVHDGYYYHTLAVFHHRLYELEPKEETKNSERQKARDCYDAALKWYGDHRSNSNLYPLLLFDYIRFTVEVEKNRTQYKELCGKIPESLHRSYRGSLLQIALYTQLAYYAHEKMIDLRTAGRWFREAEKRIELSRLNRTGHPLIANFNERFGWYLTDYWMLSPANDRFETALLIRRYNAWSSSRPIDKMYTTYGQHAMGTIFRFTGNDRKAREYFLDAKKVLADLQSDNNNLSEGFAANKKRLDAREASTLERLSDLVLYNGTESRDQYRTALEDYQKAVDLSKSSAAMLIKLEAKKVLLWLQMKSGWETDNTKKESAVFNDFVQNVQNEHTGNLEKYIVAKPVMPVIYNKFEKAKEILDELQSRKEKESKQITDDMVVPELFLKAAQITFNLLQTVEAEPDAAKKKENFQKYRNQLRDFLDRFIFFSGNDIGLRRDTMELRLHCACSLIGADWQMAAKDAKNYELAVIDAAYLSNCLDILGEKDGIHCFLRPYYEKILQIQYRLVIAADKKMQDLKENTEAVQQIKTQRQELLRSMGMNIQQMRNVSALSNLVSSSPLQSNVQNPSSKGGEQDEKPAAEVQNEKQDTKRFVGNPLIDPLTVMIFYFPDPKNVQLLRSVFKEKEEGICENGIALIIPSDGQEIRFIDLKLTRNAFINKYNDGEGNLQNEIDTIWTTLEEIDPNVARNSTFISWSEDTCWSKDSRYMLTKEMFPYKIPEKLKTVIWLE